MCQKFCNNVRCNSVVLRGFAEVGKFTNITELLDTKFMGNIIRDSTCWCIVVGIVRKF